MEQFSLPHICTCCLKLSSRLLAQKQLLTSPSSGSGQGSTSLTMSPFPPPLWAPAADLAQPGAVGTSRPSLWCCWAVHCLFAEGLLGTRLCSRPASLQSWGCCRMWHGGNEACLALGQKPGISSLCPAHGGGIIGYLFIHHPVWCNAQALGWIRIPWISLELAYEVVLQEARLRAVCPHSIPWEEQSWRV